MLKILGRGILGSLIIYGIQILTVAAGLVIPVGVNVTTFIMCAVLGFPGILLAYGISFIALYV